MKKILLIISALMTVILMGCSVEHNAKQEVKKWLKDPDSAKIEHVKTVTYNGSAYDCGNVNAKNSFGAYKSQIPFYVQELQGGHGLVVYMEGNSFFSYLEYKEICDKT